MQAEVDRKLKEMKLDMRKEIEAIPTKAQAADCAQDPTFKELEKKFEEQDREQKARAEQQRLEREIVQLRENLRNERETRMWDAIRAQELAAQESKRLMEAMAREHERDARLQEERDESVREMERRIQRIHEENAANVEQMQEMIRAQESAIQDLKMIVEEQARAQMAQLESQRAENERTERDLVGLRETLDSQREARAQEQTLRDQKAAETHGQTSMQGPASQELKSLVEGMVREHYRERDARLEEQLEESAREMKRQVQRLHEENAANAEHMQGVICAQESAIQELEKKIEEQTQTQRAQAEDQQVEHERAGRDMAQMQETLHNEREARALEDKLRGEMEEETRGQVLTLELACQELKSLMELMACEQRERDAHIEQEHSRVARDIERQLQKAQTDILGNEFQVQETMSAQGLAVEELRSRLESMVTDAWRSTPQGTS